MVYQGVLRTGVVAIAVLILFVGPVGAAIIPIANSSFETPTLADGGYTTAFTSWTGAGGAGANGPFNPTSAEYATAGGNNAPTGADGANIAFTYLPNATWQAFYQDLGDTIAPNKVYTLTTAVGYRLNRPAGDANYTLDISTTTRPLGQYLARYISDPPALTQGQFVDRSVSYTSADPAEFGKAFRIVLGAANWAAGDHGTDFDNVRLVVEDAPKSVYADKVLANLEPVVYWNMDNHNAGFAGDWSPSGSPMAYTSGEKTFDATFTGSGPSPAGGYTNMSATNVSLALDGMNDTIVNTAGHTISDAGVGTSAYSMSTWFNSSVAFGSKPASYVLSRGETYPNASVWDSVAVTNGGKLAFWNGVGADFTAVGTSTLSPNTWYNVTFVRDGASVKAYLNGDLQISTTSAFQGGSNPGNKVTVGGRADYFNWGDGCLRGSVDEAVVWDKALSPLEARQVTGLAFDRLERFSSEPGVATTFTTHILWGGSKTYTPAWDSAGGHMNVSFPSGSGASILGIERNGSWRMPDESVTLDVLDYQHTGPSSGPAGSGWANIGLAISPEQTFDWTGGGNRYVFELIKGEYGTPWYYDLRWDNNAVIATNTTAPVTGPITLTITREADDYVFWANSVELFRDDVVSRFGSDIDLSYYQIAFGADFNTTFNASLDNFGVMVPEPSSLVLLGIGAVALALAWRRRKRIS